MNYKRIVVAETAYYHCVSRVRGQEMLLTDAEKRKLWGIIENVSKFSGVEVKTYCLMDNHFHIIVKVPERREVDDAELVRRMRFLYGDAKTDMRLASWELWSASGGSDKVNEAKAALRRRMYNLSDFFKTFKERFSKDFNTRKKCTGCFWSERFKSIILAPESKILSEVGAYIDLNPVRAKTVERAGDYVFSGFGAASRGDTAALEGIRELIAPRNTSKTSVADAFNAYKKIIGGGDAKKELRRTRRDFIVGAAIGSLKFIGNVLGFVLGAGFEIRQKCCLSYNPGWENYYHARRVNKIK